MSKFPSLPLSTALRTGRARSIVNCREHHPNLATTPPDFLTSGAVPIFRRIPTAITEKSARIFDRARPLRAPQRSTSGRLFENSSESSIKIKVRLPYFLARSRFSWIASKTLVRPKPVKSQSSFMEYASFWRFTAGASIEDASVPR